MASLHAEYDRFLHWLRSQETAEDVRRIAKIVRSDLDDLAPLGTAGGARAMRLTPLIRELLTETDPEIDENLGVAHASPIPWTKLEQIRLGPFRGFRFEKTIAFPKQYTLVYGPNGAGKTSLCEALEFALLGEVEEASAKRLNASLDTYLKNSHEDSFVSPLLTGNLAQGGSAAIDPNADLYRFCFIEKNRIDDFAKLSARSPAKADALIALLFGLRSFDDFTNGFTTKLRTIEDAPKKHEWELKLRGLDSQRQLIESEAEGLERVADEERELASSYKEGAPLAELLRALGRDGDTGRLQELDTALSEQIPPPIGVYDFHLKELRAQIREILRNLAACTEALSAKTTAISFRDLYKAILAVSDESPSACPACDTPLEQVTSNPFDKAGVGLEALHELSALEQREHDLARESVSHYATMGRLAATLVRALPDEPESRSLHSELKFDDASPYGNQLSSDHVSASAWRDLLRLSKKAQIRDEASAKLHVELGALRAERDRLRLLDKKLDACHAKRELISAQAEQAKKKIESFDLDNAELKASVATEAQTLQLEQRMATAYKEFRERLHAYRDELPESLVSDLSDTAKSLYNSFNADDPDQEKLATLTLPARGGEPILISFNGRDGQHNALHLLSEGHLRCLGLAILLAKNIKLELPLVIFDDVVNAIDHEHRGAIRDTVFSD